MATLPLPTDLPQWYTVDQEKGWTPKTSDIIEKPENHETTHAWNGMVYPPLAQRYTVKIDRLKVISPIQVGGGSFPEGGILPAQVGGVPYIPGSSIKGAFLNWLNQQWQDFATEERDFWLSLIAPDRKSWQPRKIRFESILLKNLKPFPLNPQQEWQVLNQKNTKLGIQWQVSPKHPPSPSADQFTLQVLLKEPPTDQQQKWLKTQLTQMLQEQGVGRGTASGFGRLASRTPDGIWEIELTGMKPCIQPKDDKKGQVGLYRWSPQVLRACLRGYFTRLALSLLPQDQALTLTDSVFGGLGRCAQLTLTSYLSPVGSPRQIPNGYVNIPAKDAHAVWRIQVACNSEFQTLIGELLELASRLGGLGPGWRRPPHKLDRFGGFRGSQFSYTPKSSEEPISVLITHLQNLVRDLAEAKSFEPFREPIRPQGSLISIWQGKAEQWTNIVHGICSTSAKPRPDWCGDSKSRPSGYSVRQYDDYCLITVFDQSVETTLETEAFHRIW